MNIAIVTVYDSIINNGSFLQAYALKRTLEEMGHKTCFIRRMPDEKILGRFNSITAVQNAPRRGSRLKRPLLKLKSKYIIKREQNANLKRLSCFKKDWEKIDIIDQSELKEKKIDLVICGSDEIWNTHNADIDLGFYACGGIDEIPKLAYAISSGDIRPEELFREDGAMEAIGDFNRILPRDLMTQKLALKVTGKKEDIVCDPTILLGRDGFEQKSETEIKGKYMLIYAYYLSDNQKNLIKRYAKENGLRIVSPCIYSSIADEVVYASSLEFPSLIKNAECVYTSTFHGAIFSLMFAKRMCCSPKLPKIDNLLKLANASSYALTDESYQNFKKILDGEIDRKTVDKALCGMRTFSRAKLSEALDEISAKGKAPLGVHYNDDTKYYYGYSLDNANMRSKSSSGGMFGELAKKILENGGVVFGAAYNSDTQQVEHLCTEDVELERLMRSKYVESKLTNSFKRIEGFLKEGREVLFCGTPCQCAGLAKLRSSALKAYGDRLFIVDFLCEGVPSGKVLKGYIESAEKKYGKKITDLNFRSKYYGWNVHCLLHGFEDGSFAVEPHFENTYIHSFINDLIFNRPSCYSCKFREEKRSDITIGDFWKIADVEPSENDNKGVSAVFVHTSLGERLLESVSARMKLKKLSDRNICDMKQYLDISAKKERRDLFYQEFAERGYDGAVKKYGTCLSLKGAKGALKIKKRKKKLGNH